MTNELKWCSTKRRIQVQISCLNRLRVCILSQQLYLFTIEILFMSLNCFYLMCLKASLITRLLQPLSRLIALAVSFLVAQQVIFKFVMLQSTSH
jgi:hypothetical protein